MYDPDDPAADWGQAVQEALQERVAKTSLYNSYCLKVRSLSKDFTQVRRSFHLLDRRLNTLVSYSMCIVMVHGAERSACPSCSALSSSPLVCIVRGFAPRFFSKSLGRPPPEATQAIEWACDGFQSSGKVSKPEAPEGKGQKGATKGTPHEPLWFSNWGCTNLKPEAFTLVIWWAERVTQAKRMNIRPWDPDVNTT